MAKQSSRLSSDVWAILFSLALGALVWLRVIKNISW
jgi:hypothetical protein